MLEICLKNKIIFNFIKNYKQKKWNNIIPSLLEIAILNLYTSFKRLIFSEEDLSLIIENLKLKYNLPLSNERNSKIKKIVNNNNNKETVDLNIPKFRKNLKLNLHDYLKGRKDSYRSYTKKAKNINELNIYINNEKRKIHYYNKSGEIKPKKGLINYNETDVSYGENKYKNIFKINKLNKRHNKNNIKCINIYNKDKDKDKDKKIIDYNTMDHSDYINNTYESIFNLYKNFNQNMNYSFSIDYNKSRGLIKVNKNNKSNKSNKKIIDSIYNNNEKEYLMKKDNNYYSKNNKEIDYKTNKNNKILKYKIINYKKFKNSFNLLNFNQKQIIKPEENKNKLNLNNINYYYKEKNPTKHISQTANNSLINNSPKKQYSEIIGLIKLQKYKNSNPIINNSLNINKNNVKEINNNQFSNIQKNFKDINLRNILSKERRTENNTNKEVKDDTNNTFSNINDISYLKYNNNYFKQCFGTKIKNNSKKININYNSFNNNKNTKKSIFLNDPSLFIKNSGKKKLSSIKKNININANGNEKNIYNKNN